MIWTIARRELLANLLSLRFVLGLVVSVGMMGLVAQVLLQEYAARHQEYLVSVQQHEQELAQTKVYSAIAVTVDLPPSPMSIFSRGTRDLPVTATVSPFHLPSLVDAHPTQMRLDLGEGPFATSSEVRPRTDNPLLRLFTTIDLSFVVSTILTLFAILLVFDGFSGEREQRTLAMVLATPLSRSDLLAGKFLGALLTAAVPLAAGFLVTLLMMGLAGGLTGDGLPWVSLGLLYLVSLLLLAGFLALGLFFSVWAPSSAAGLIYTLLAWVVLVVVVPAGGRYLAQQAQPQMARQRFVEASAQAEQAFLQANNKEADQHLEPRMGQSRYALGSFMLLATSQQGMDRFVALHQQLVPRQLRFAEEQYRRVEEYEQALRRWQRWQAALTVTSPSEVYQRAAAGLAATDAASYDQVLTQVRRYRGQLVEYVRPWIGRPEWFTRLPEHPELLVTPEREAAWMKQIQSGDSSTLSSLLSWDRIEPLDLTAMPRLRVTGPGVAERIAGAVTAILLLAGFAVLFLALAARQVRRCAVQ